MGMMIHMKSGNCVCVCIYVCVCARVQRHMAGSVASPGLVCEVSSCLCTFHFTFSSCYVCGSVVDLN